MRISRFVRESLQRTSLLAAMAVGISACGNGGQNFDATGTFEADEVIVSSELSGKLESFTVEEGRRVSKDAVVGVIDSKGLILQKEQVQASLSALGEKTSDVSSQIALLQQQLAVQKSQLDHQQNEQRRIENLVKADAATGKDLDDIGSKVDVLQKQMLVTKQQIAVQQSTTSTQNRSILSENEPLQKRIAQLDDQIQRAQIVNPIGGVVLTKYAQAGEMTAAGKALYKVSDLSELTLRAYITGNQLSQVKLGQQVKVLVDEGADKYKTYAGVVSWISDKAEFTPKTIQTKEERANLVYATKIKVKNDGYLKIGMYGEVELN